MGVNGTDVNPVSLENRLATLETLMVGVSGDIKRLEQTTERVITMIEKRESAILKEVDELEREIHAMRQTVGELEKKLSYWQGVVAVIAFIWPAILKWVL